MKICIYGASSDRLEREFFTEAEKLGRLIAQSGHSLVFGGGKSGLMGACAKGARMAGGHITGIAPRFFDEPGILDKDCNEFIYTDTMRQRKALMEELSEAFIALPGGIGSYEEFFEILTLKQLGRHCKPICLLNTLGYYSPLMALLENTAERGFMSESCLSLFTLCESPEQCIESLAGSKSPAGSIRRLTDYNK